MNKHPVFLLTLIIALVVIVVGYRFNDFYLNKNFQLSVTTSCNPESEECFVMNCDPEVDEGCDVTPYKKVEIAKKEAPACLEEHECENFSCNDLESCSVTECSDDNVEEWEMCYLHTEEASIESETDAEVAPEDDTNENAQE